MNIYENISFELMDIIKMKRLCALIAIRIHRIETTCIRNLSEYYRLKQAYKCYKEYV
jgi:hypothetical protein